MVAEEGRDLNPVLAGGTDAVVGVVGDVFEGAGEAFLLKSLDDTVAHVGRGPHLVFLCGEKKDGAVCLFDGDSGGCVFWSRVGESLFVYLEELAGQHSLEEVGVHDVGHER